jgi:FkbM family methyltransferase
MNFSNAAWRQAPVRTSIRVAKSLARRALPRLSRVAVPYDGGRTSILADLRTPMGLALYRYGHQDPDLELISRMLSPGDVFVDGGANVGLFTLVAASRVGPQGKVVAFEPGRAVRLRLLENVVLNRLVQVSVMPIALSSRAGDAAFRVFEIGGAGLNHLAPAQDEAGDVETVTLATLDSVLTPSDRRRLSFIKLDLEGAEHDALVGASSTLAESHPDILIEVEPTHLARMGTSAEAVEGLLRGHGYRLFRRTEGAEALHWTEVSAFGPAGSQPNVLATVDAERLRRRGVAVS